MIFICEDDEKIARLFNLKLTMEGHQTKIFYDGESLITHLQTEIPDLLITDIMMPGYDGFTVLKLIRGDERLKNMKVMIITAVSHNSDLYNFKNSGADDYMTKPILLNDFIARVKKLLQRPA